MKRPRGRPPKDPRNAKPLSKSKLKLVEQEGSNSDVSDRFPASDDMVNSVSTGNYSSAENMNSIAGARFLEWPEVPVESRPRKLFVNELVDKSVSVILSARGWQVVDVRILPGDNDVERSEAVQATLSGARTGSIILSSQQLRGVEIAARACGLVGNKETVAPEAIEDTTSADVMDLLSSFSTGAVFGVTTKSEIVKKTVKDLLSDAGIEKWKPQGRPRTTVPGEPRWEEATIKKKRLYWENKAARIEEEKKLVEVARKKTQALQATLETEQSE